MSPNLDFMGALLDEIALEGLDGITMPSLWKRLEKRPNFSMPIDELSKQFLWGCIFQHKEIEIFQLEEARQPLVIYNRYNNLDLEMGIVVDSDDSVSDIYPHAPVQSTNLKGSCATFNTRKNVSDVIKVHGKSYTMSMSIYGEERLVLVASQELRNGALFGTEVQPNIDLSQIQFCILERIGRSRYHGETTMGRMSLAQMKIASKSMFYLRKFLIKLNIITKQVHLQRIGNATQHSSLLHLRRFYVERLSKLQVMLLKMCEILDQKPNKRELFHVLRTELGMKETSFKKMFNKALQVCVQAKLIPYGEFYPNAPDEKRFAANGKERIVKIASLIKKYEEPDEEDYEDEDEEGKSEIRVSLDPRKITFDEPILTQVYNMVERAGPFGISGAALKIDLGISKLDIRLLLRNLERRNVIFTVSQDIGRQRSTLYAAKCFEQENLEKNNLIEIKKKILSYSDELPPYEPNEEMIIEDVLPKALQERFNEMDSIQVHFHEEDKSERLTKAWDFSLKDISSICQETTGKNLKEKESPNYTYKMLKRVNMIIEAVRKNRLIEDPFHLQKLIVQSEQEEGMLEKIDKKSTHRIISRLAKDGYIRSIKTTLSMGKRVKKLHFVCDSRLTADDPLIKSAIEQAKLKYFSISKPGEQLTGTGHLAAVHDEEGVGDSGLLVRKITDLNEGKAKMEYIPSIGRVYGLQPKFLRMKSLHQFLFYLTYDYGGSQLPLPLKDESSPPVYHMSDTWKHFVPPLPRHAGKTKGWCLFSDVLLCMPLSLLMKVVNFTYKIEGLEEFALDPVRQHFLIRHLPQQIRNSLLVGRRYIFAVHEVMTKLSFMGLLTFGPQQYKEKDQVFLYIHQNATLKDTTLSEPGYMSTTPDLNYVFKKYHMETFDHVESYWYDLENLCMHTPLGSMGSTRGRAVEVKNLYKEAAMIEAARQKTFQEVVDEGITPGDGLGAAGLDSAMFAHLRRNWSWPADSALHLNRLAKKKELISKDSGYGAGVSYKKYLVEKDNEIASVTDSSKTKRLSRLLGVNKLLLSNDQTPLSEHEPEERNAEHQSTKNLTSIIPNIKSRKGYKRKAVSSPEKPLAKRQKKVEKKVKKIPKSREKPRKPYYDEIDKMALNRMSKQRVCWTVQEDSFLLLCKVASCFLDPHFKSMVIPFSTIREFMHKRFPNLSSNKTSRACQRRIHFMMRNPTTIANVSVFLLEAKQDVELVRQFQGPKPIKRDETAWTEMFTTVLDHLIEKFTLSLKDRCVQLALPSSLDEFNSLYKVCVTGTIKDDKCMHVDPKNFVDIYCSVMFSFILSSMFTIGDKNNWSYTLYRVYQQYPDTLLRSIVARLKRDRLITKRKDYNPRIELTIPLSALPHKISVHFDTNLQPRYQHQIYSQGANLFKTMTKDHSLSEPQGLEMSGSVEPGDTALIVSLATTQNVVFEIQLPEQVIIFDSTITEDLKSRIREKVKQYEKEDAQDLTQIDKDEMSIESTAETNFEVSSSKASRIALYMLRHELGHSLTDNIQHAHDYFLVNTCGIRCILRLHRHNKWYPLSPFKAQSAMDSQRVFLPLEIVKPTSEIIYQVYSNSGYSNDVAEDGVTLMNFILEKKEFGSTLLELYYLPVEKALSLKEHLKILILHNLILRVGVTCFRYVALMHSRPWVLNSFKVPKEKKSHLTEIATERDKQTVQTLKSQLRSGKKLQPENDPLVANLPTNNDLHIDDVIKEPSDACYNVLENGEKYVVSEIIEDISSVNDSDVDFKMKEIFSDCIQGILMKIQSFNVDSDSPENALICADSLFKVAVTMLEFFSENRNQERLIQILDGLPGKLKELFNPLNTIIELILTCTRKSNFSEILELLGSTDFVQKVLSVLGTLENTPELVHTKNLFVSVFFTCYDISLESNCDFVSVFTQLLSSTLLKGLEILLHTYKHCNVLQALNILTMKILDLKNKCSAKTSNQIENWFEVNIMNPLESQNDHAELHVPGGKKCHRKDIENWFEDSIMARLNDPDKCVKKTLELAVKCCVNDLINKAGSQTTVTCDDMKDWLQETIISKIESEELQSWLQSCVLMKLENINDQDNSLNDWLVETVLNQVGSSVLENEKFLQIWLDETVLSKVTEKNETLELSEWMERLIHIIINDERKTSDEKTELRNWMNSFILEKVENLAKVEIEKHSLRKWFEDNVLSFFETTNPVEHIIHPSDIKNILLEAIQLIEENESVHLFRETRKKLNEVIQKILIEEDSKNDLHKWFNNCILYRIQEQCNEIPNEITQWFEESILKVVGKSNQNLVVDIKEVKLWLEEEVLKLLNDKENTMSIPELQSWFEINILNVIKDFDQGITISSTEDITKWFHERIMLSVDEQCSITTKIKGDFEENVSKLLERTQSGNVEYFEETKRWFEEKIMKQISETENRNTSFEVKEWFQEHILKIFDDIDKVNIEKELKSDVWKCFKQSVLDVLKELLEAKNCLESDVLAVITRDIEATECLEKSVLDVVVTTSELVESTSNAEGMDIDYTTNTKTNETALFKESNVLDVLQATECLEKSVLDVVVTTSELVESTSDTEGMDIDCTTKQTANETALSMEYNVLDIIQATECLEKSVLDVVITTSKLVESASNAECLGVDSISNEAALCVESVLDVIETTYYLVNTISKSSELSIEAKTHATTLSVYENLEVMECLQNSISNVIEATSDMTISSQENTKYLSVEEPKKFLKESVIDIIDTTTEIVNFVSQQMNIDHPTIANSKECLEESVLEVIDTTVDILKYIDDNLPSDQILASENKKIASFGIFCTNSSGNQEDKSVKDITEKEIFIAVEEMSVLNSDKTSNEKSEPSQNFIETENLDQTSNIEVPIILETAVLDIIETTSGLVRSVTNSSETKADITLEESLPMDVFAQASNCLEDSVLTVVDKVSECLDSIEMLETVDVSGNDIEKDIINVTSEIISSLENVELHELPPKRPKITSDNSDILRIANSRRDPDSAAEVSKVPDDGSEQEGRGKRKRIRRSMFESVTVTTATECEPVRFVSRPWRKPDGSLNRKILERYLVAMLSHVMTNPGISEKDIFLRFESTMQPILILELLEILSECECVTNIHMKLSHAPNLFECPVSYTLMPEWQPDIEVFYEGTPDAILKLSYFISEFLHYRT